MDYSMPGFPVHYQLLELAIFNFKNWVLVYCWPLNFLNVFLLVFQQSTHTEKSTQNIAVEFSEWHSELLKANICVPEIPGLGALGRRQCPVGSWERKPFIFFLFLEGKIPASVTFLELQRADSNNCSSREEQPRNHLRQESLRPRGLQHVRPPCPTSTPGALLKFMSIESLDMSISSSVVPLCSCLQSFPASGSFPMSPFFTSGGQSIGVSDSASVLPMNVQDWFPLGNGWISLQSKGLSRVFSNTTGQKHQFFGAQPSAF